jgi:phosphate:Na+ symporter
MVLGENIGTTITANIAAAVGNISAKRTARVHLIFNVLGVIWMLAVFNNYTGLIDTLMTKNGGASPNESPAAIPTALSIFHSSFNILNVLIFVWFSPLIQRFVEYLVPYQTKEFDEEFRLKYITTGMLSTSELSILQAKKEIQFYAKHTTKMFGFFRKMINEEKDKKFNKLLSRVQKYEGISDNVEVEITNYLSQISQYKLSELGRKRIKSMLKLSGDLESVADSNYNLARTVNRMREKNITFSLSANEKLELMFNLVEEALSVMRENLQQDELVVSLTKARLLENQINNYRNQLKSEHLDNLTNNVYSNEAGIIFNDLFSECEKLADYAINVSEALEEVGL